MMRYIKYIFLPVLLMMPSCNKYLDVQPEDRFVENDVYGSPHSIRNVLNGIYINLAKPGAYGENFTATTLDVMAQYYDCSNNGHPFYTTLAYNYTDAAMMGRITAMWNNSYTAILNLNLFIKHLEQDKNILSENEKQLMLGEAYGLRAFVEFDLLRLFGPVYATDSLKAAIPYPREPASKVQPLLPANKVLSGVLDDLSIAANLLKNDPVRTKGGRAVASGEDAYFSLRNRRMNYYAVKALLARVLLYRGDLAGAGIAANDVIKEVAMLFPWSPSDFSAAGIANPDRIFSSEVIFALENANMYTTQRLRFDANLRGNEILMPAPQQLENIYEHNANDYRYRVNFDIKRTTTRTDKTFFKYADISDMSRLYRKLQPLIRMTELYYISAESETDDNKAAALLNTVRFNRGLPALTLNGDKQTQILKEYQKEFWGEGQLFFYFKRTQQTSIGSSISDDAQVMMSPAKYVLPLPLSETPFR